MERLSYDSTAHYQSVAKNASTAPSALIPWHMCASGREFLERLLFGGQICLQIDGYGLDALVTSQSAITAMSTPDCNRCIAVVCRRTCGVIRLSLRVRQVRRARPTACCKI